MPNIASVLRDEITRLARKHIKHETAALRRASAQYRRDIAQLKRELHDANRRLALLETDARKSRQRTVEKLDTEGKRFSARGVKSHRQALGLSAADYGTLCGVTGKTIYLWESGQSRPRAKAFARWIAIRPLGKRAALARLPEHG